MDEDEFADLGGDPDESANPDSGDDGSPSIPGIDIPADGADVTLADIAREVDEGGPADDAGDGEDDPGAVDDALVAHPGLKALIDRTHQGNVDKFLNSLDASKSEAQRLAAENALLKAGRPSGDPAPPPPSKEQREAAIKEALAQAPEVQSFTAELTSLDNEMKGREQLLVTLSTSAGELALKVRDLETRVSLTPDETQRAQLNTELMLTRQKLDGTEQRFANTEELYKQDQRQRKLVVAQLNSSKRAVINEVDGRAAHHANREANALQVRRNFDMAFTDIITDYDIGKPGSDAYKHTYAMVKARLADHLVAGSQAGKPGLDAAGIHEATRRILSSMEKFSGLKRRTAAPRAPGAPRPTRTPQRPLAAPRVPSSPRSTPAGAAPAPVAGSDTTDNRPRTQAELENDPNYWRQRKERIEQTARQRVAAQVAGR